MKVIENIDRPKGFRLRCSLLHIMKVVEKFVCPRAYIEQFLVDPHSGKVLESHVRHLQ